VTLAPVLLLTAAVWARSEFDARAKSGMELLLHGDAAQAEVNLREAVRMSPDSADAHAALALILIEGHNRPEALAEYKHALRLDRRFIEGRRISAVLSGHGWAGDTPEFWDMEMGDLAMEILNEPKAHEKPVFKANIHFPAGWMVDAGTARPDMTDSRASISTAGGKDELTAEDAYDWFEKARKAARASYRGFKLLDKRVCDRGGASCIQLLYRHDRLRFRESFEALDVILLKDGQYRRATYDAPETEFETHFDLATRSLDTLQF
jgi:tetratricopeptide (TPR) repeat protein